MNAERLDALLPGGQFGVGLLLAAQLLGQAVVLRAELAAQPGPPHLAHGHHHVATTTMTAMTMPIIAPVDILTSVRCRNLPPTPPARLG